MKLIYLKWRDACKQVNAPIEISRIDNVCMIETVGFLVDDSEDVYSVAMNYHDEDLIEYVMHIPKKYVISKKFLSLKGVK